MQFLLHALHDAKNSLNLFEDVMNKDYFSVQGGFFNNLVKLTKEKGHDQKWDETSPF